MSKNRLTDNRLTRTETDRWHTAGIGDTSGALDPDPTGGTGDAAQARDNAPAPTSLADQARTLGHDFNNLIGAVLNYATLVERNLTDPVARDDIAQIQAAAERANVLVQEFVTTVISATSDAAPAAAPTPSPGTVPASTAARHGGTEHILLVEDEDALRAATTRILNEQGYRVTSATDGRHALEVMAGLSGPVDLVLTDVIMPKMSGPQLVAELRNHGDPPRFLFLSGYPGTEADPDTRLVGKPFTEESLLTAVREVLDGPG